MKRFANIRATNLTSVNLIVNVNEAKERASAQMMQFMGYLISVQYYPID